MTNTTLDYDEFLRNKVRRLPDKGIVVEIDSLHPALYGFQRSITKWALRKGSCAIFADCGMGKTIMQCEWARQIADSTLIVAPLSVARQTVREANLIDLDVRYVRDGSEVSGPGVWITNYEMVSRFDPSMFGAVVIDECFAAGTLVDTPDGPKHIEDFRIGDLVNSASGSDVVWDVHRRKIPYAIEVRFGPETVTCSPNHPWFTQRGWVGAQDLEPGDSLVSTAEAVRMVRGELRQDQETDSRDISFLQHVLLSEMEDERPGSGGEAPHSRSDGEERSVEASLVGVGAARSGSREGPNPTSQSHATAGSAGQGLPHIESDGPRSFRAWGQWSGDDFGAIDDAGCTWRGVGSRVVSLTGPTDSGISDALQARLGERRDASSYRGGWKIPLLPQSPGRQKGCQADFARVDSIEVLEPSDSRLDGVRNADGSLCFYDLGVVGHPSFSVAGRLVHNSSILKNVDSVTRRVLTEQFARTPYRLACTATPAPNDVSELVNHAEFLGIMPRNEMLAAYFVHDDEGWRLKGHAAEPMYRWMATWAVALRRPSDIGYPNDGYELPPLSIVPQIVRSKIPGGAGQLFATELGGVGGRANVRRHTLDARVSRAVALAEGTDQWIIWCGLNDEAKSVTSMVDGAVNVEGSWEPERKAEALESFQDGSIRVLVTKPSIAGFGMNFQQCSHMAFLGLSDSYEAYFQAIRRCYRYGQTSPVIAHIILSDIEEQIVVNIRRKEGESQHTTDRLIAHVSRELQESA